MIFINKNFYHATFKSFTHLGLEVKTKYLKIAYKTYNLLLMNILLFDKRLQSNFIKFSNQEIFWGINSFTPYPNVIKCILNDYKSDGRIINNLFDKSIELNYHSIIQYFIDDKRIHLLFLKTKFVKACALGKDKIVEIFLKDDRINPSDIKNTPIRIACVNGHYETVKILLSDKRVDPSDRNQECIRVASHLGFKKIVKLLLTDSRVDQTSII